jgi:DNA-binding NarL/FixJ family response regulator
VLSQLGMDVVGEVADAESLVAMAHLEEPDLVLTDIRMPLTGTDDGLRAALRIRALRPRTPVVVLSQFVQRRYAVELLADHAAGAGYLLKQRILDVPALCRELRRVTAGGTALDPDVVALMMTRSLSDDEAPDSLTPRRREVLALIAEGLNNAAIADGCASPRRPSSCTPPASTNRSASPSTTTSTGASWPWCATSGADQSGARPSGVPANAGDHLAD